jgi:hypothetical protein
MQEYVDVENCAASNFKVRVTLYREILHSLKRILTRHNSVAFAKTLAHWFPHSPPLDHIYKPFIKGIWDDKPHFHALLPLTATRIAVLRYLDVFFSPTKAPCFPSSV